MRSLFLTPHFSSSLAGKCRDSRHSRHHRDETARLSSQEAVVNAIGG
jgi:hypothetical protein